MRPKELDVLTRIAVIVEEVTGEYPSHYDAVVDGVEKMRQMVCRADTEIEWDCGDNGSR